MERSKITKLTTIAFWILIIVALGFMALSIYLFTSKTSECIKQPFIYAINTVAEKDAYVECNCMAFKDNQMGKFAFNRTNIWIVEEP